MTTPMPWARFTLPVAYAPSLTGAPVPGAKLYFFEGSLSGAGTSTPLDTFSDATLSTPNDNPVEANQGGIFPDIFLQDAIYRVILTDAAGNELYTWNPVEAFSPESDEAQPTFVIEMTVDGNQQTPLVGVCGDLYVPFACTITKAVLQADQPGNLIIDVWSAPFAVNTPPNASNSITASEPPTLDTAQSSIDTVLTGWSKVLPADSALRFNIVEVETLFRFTLSLVVTATVAVP